MSEANDCISRQMAIDTLIKWADGYSYIEVPTGYAIEKFERIPSADVVEVVRCEKCCFAKPFNEVWFQPKRETIWCSVFMEEREPEWFCANAERRTDGEIH